MKVISKIFKKFHRKKKWDLAGFLFILITVVVCAEFIAVEWTMFRRIQSEAPREKIPQKLEISTDKNFYRPSEPVLITINNNTASSSVKQQPGQLVRGQIVARKYFGRNYGVGLIEKFVNNIWLAAEPILRCGRSCFTKCESGDISIGATQENAYSWDQSLFVCDYVQKTENTVWSGPGRYRVTAALWSEEKQAIELCHSGEFTIGQ